MNLKNKIYHFFVFLGFLLIASGAHALEALEVTTVFFNNDNSVEFHQDIDQNILELSRNDITKELSITLFRELPEYDYLYRPEGKGAGVIANHLFSTPYLKPDFKVPGTFSKMGVGALERSGALEKILRSGFKNPHSLKVLFLYGHGVGATGFKDKDISLIKNEILQFIQNNDGQKIDLIVYDSCFLGNLEFLYEMRELSTYSMASSESEFSQGQPFEVLDSLLVSIQNSSTKQMAIKKVAADLLIKFLSSYSTIEKGKNANMVDTSSAVFALFDNSKFESLIADLKKLRKELSKLSLEKQNHLNKKWQKYAMDDQKLIDLGGFLKVLCLEDQNKENKEIAVLAKNLLNTLNITESDFKSVSPAIQMRSPKPNEALALISVNNKSGEALNKLLPTLKNIQTTPFTREGEVAVKVNKVLRIAPFLPHIQSVEIRFIDPKTGKTLGLEKSIKRTKDLKIHENKMTSPIQFFGFTESQKTIEKRYSGLNISHPFKPMPNFDYMNLEFQSKTQWLK